MWNLKSATVGFLSQMAVCLVGGLLIMALSLLSLGCATNQGSYNSGDKAVVDGPHGDDISRSIFYSKVAEKQRRKAENYLELAISYETVQGADSALAVHYRQLAEQSLKSAEENARFSRFHRQLAEEEFDILREEMFPQP